MAKLVNWREFETQMKERQLLLFSSRDVQKVFPISPIAASFLLYRYTNKGFIKRVKRGLYIFPDAIPPDPYIANKLCDPSYVSLQFALSYHGVIPETVYEITSITTKTTRQYVTLNKSFAYRRITKKAFTGYLIQKENNFSFIIADPEKALVDTLYFRLKDKLGPIDRLKKEKINKVKAMEYARQFNNSSLIKLLNETLK